MRLLGLSYEGVHWGSGGSREAPYHIFTALKDLEGYSLLFERDIDFEVIGTLQIEGYEEDAINEIESAVTQDIGGYIGGDHSISLGVIRGLKRYWDRFRVVILDAHLDFRDVFMGSRLNHGTVTRRIYEEIGDVTVMGVRNVSRGEVLEAKEKIRFVPYKLTPLYTDTPVYLSIDIDVFDPSEAPGTGTPEPGGISFRMFLKWLRESSFPLIAFDIVEVSPSKDYSQNTIRLAANIIKEIGSRFFG